MDVLGKLILDNIVGFGIATIIVIPVAGYFYKIVMDYVIKQKEEMYKQIDLIVDPAIRKLVEDIILNIEDAIGSTGGQIKFEKAKAQILAKVPDILDPVVDKLLQGVYDGLKEKRKI